MGSGAELVCYIAQPMHHYWSKQIINILNVSKTHYGAGLISKLGSYGFR